MYIIDLCDAQTRCFWCEYFQVFLVGSYLQASVQRDVNAALQSTSDVTAQTQHQPMDCSEAEAVVTRGKINKKHRVDVKQSSGSKKQEMASQSGLKNGKVTSQTGHKRRRVPENINIGALQNL